ncbi:aldehyde dehydrogenase family protein [Pseudonocardia sp.]|uniref:aldehyde dehydrogenase family protein n=1 Tax=Pseudonocardia sp. TaxID=60912 RepID=UPI002608E5AB|nr:aldehyde dehydrogenase family protein [Pseudonocardia sp.]MCW2718360.1 Aldehyde Dehydrogenase [Pseudonocardia sp.]MDT7618376.1 aldehyde dehydrogenase [Pseudonocardiales bacterium]
MSTTTTTTSTSPQLGETRMLVDGKLVESRSGRSFDNINPATEEVLGSTTDADSGDMDRAIAAARRAFDATSWSTDHAFRRRCLEQLHHALDAEREELRAELIAEAGCPAIATFGPQLDWPLDDALRWPAELISTFPWERTLPDTELFGMTSHRVVWKEAVGVVGAICPWNYPVEVVIGKVGQILATGNTAVVKPAPDTPWNATRLGRLIAEHTDIPPGVINIVTSSDHALGEQLVLDPRVDMISFTGSTATGKRIAEKAAATMKRTFLELGGKSAMIVLDDADLAATVPGASFMCMHAGQGCAMQTRLLVPRNRYDEAVELVTAAFAAVSYGDPTDPANLAGPLINAKQRERVLGYIEKGVQEGARLTTGGGVPAHLERGFFVEPTVFADVDNTMTVAREEIFGPVLAVIPFDDDADAVRIANDNDYGLSGGVFSADRGRALSVARRLRVGSAMVNGGLFYGADSPYGGYKASGVGRQNGLEGFEQHLQTKAVGFADDVDD